MNYKEILPFWVSVPHLLRKPQPVYRLDGGDLRYYMTISDQHQVMFFPSVTSILNATSPMPPYLLKWIADHGKQRAEQLRDQKAEYGTCLHIMLGMYLTNDRYDLDVVPLFIKHYVAEKKFSFDTSYWATEMKRDLLAFHQFCEDYQVEPLAIEMALVNDEDGFRFGGAIDLVCEITVKETGFWGEVYKSGENKGKPKETKRERRTIAIVDFKSGRHGFYESHEIQANMYRRMWNNQFPDHQAEFCYNWRPKDWDTTPSYELKNQTDRESAQQIPALISLFGQREKSAPSGRQVIGGIISRGRPLSENNIQYKSAEQIALDMYPPKTSPSASIPTPEQAVEQAAREEAAKLIAFTPEQEAVRKAAGVTDETLRNEGLEITMQKINDVLPAANLNEEPIPETMPEPQTFVFNNDTPVTPQEAISPTLHKLKQEARKNGAALQPL